MPKSYTSSHKAILTIVHSSSGLRVDGRRPNELRKIIAKTSVLAQADGSAYIEQGNTKVLAAVYGPQEVCSNIGLQNVRTI
jgi:ribonuclease PH